MPSRGVAHGHQGPVSEDPFQRVSASPVPQEDAELTHVGPETPGGEYMRRFWQPICFSDELRDLPKRVRILGEDLVAFRDGGGSIGVLELHCPIAALRSSSAWSARRGSAAAITAGCLVSTATILETPGEPASSTLKDSLFHGAYPVHEAHGLVFAYMGPPAEMPVFPIYDSLIRPGYRMIPGRKYFYPCNWLQIQDNTMDPAHTAFLHTIVSGAMFTEEFGVLPELDFLETPIGMIYVATRRVGDNVWARMVEIVLPNLQQVAPIWENGRQERGFSGPMMSRWLVPMDDSNTMFIELRHVSETEGDETPAWWADREQMLPGQIAMPRPTRRASGIPATSRRRCRSGRSRCMGLSISARPIAASACSAIRSAAASARCAAASDPRGCCATAR